VLDAEGLEHLTMRRLAEQLGVRSASLYWHVRDKDQLLDLLADAICAELDPPPPSSDWRADLIALARAYRQVLHRHRDAAVVVASTLPLGPQRLRLADTLLGRLLGAGCAPPVAAMAGLLFTDFVTNFVIEEGRAEHVARAFAATSTRLPAEGFEAIQTWFAGLPADQYPSLVALASQLGGQDADERFEFGITTLLDGLDRRIQQPPP
jgi:TetR/AcrR family tetracycline transcriptional repressor